MESGDYLWSCLCYLELNMVRCVVVSHPRDWKWVGYHELMGHWRRNRVIDLDRLCWRLGIASPEEVRKNLEISLAQRIARNRIEREACWTESLAVGSVSFLESIQPQISSRMETEIVQTIGAQWALQETPVPYGRENGSEKGAIRPKTA